jgi:hypothetical protein
MGRLSRLRDMPPREIGFRLRERILLEAERIRHGLRVAGSRLAPSRRSSLPDSPGDARPVLLESLATRFYISPEERTTLPSFVRAHFPEWVRKAIGEADALCDHRVELLGYGTVDLGPKINWHRDPVTGVEWPRRFWADYDPVNDTAYGDSKTIHELNRHQHLPRLGKAYFLTGDERYALEAIDQIESWIAQNPEGTGINWQSSLEIAIRALSWLWSIFFLLPSPAFTNEVARGAMESLLAQLRHVRRYPSVYSSPNTHLIGEATALFIGGLLLDGTAETRTWRDFGADLLAQEIHRQVLHDGVHCELSTGYHCYATDFYMQALILARRNHCDFPLQVAVKVEQMLEFVMHISRPDGSIPQLGDDDGGRALALDRQDYRCYRDGLSSGAVLFDRPDFKWQSHAFQEETLWLLGRDACTLYTMLPATVPYGKSQVFDAAGYLVHRTGWTEDDSHAVFDCGGLGAPTGGHGHADALSLVLFSGGRDLLIDSGTCVYNGAPEWRDYFRSSYAHNTVVVDGCDQSEQAGTFQWRSRAVARELPCSPNGLDSVAGEHTGYERLASPVLHKRRVSFCEDGSCVIVDELLGIGVHTFDFLYHFPRELDLRFTSESPLRVEVRVNAPQGEALLVLCTTAPGEAEVITGWVSPRCGKRERTNVLRLRVKTAAPLFASTVIGTFARRPGEKGRAQCAESAELLSSMQTTR